MPSLQVFINAAVNYAITMLRNTNADLNFSNFIFSQSVHVSPGEKISHNDEEKHKKKVKQRKSPKITKSID